jgi:hypothetical protein
MILKGDDGTVKKVRTVLVDVTIDEISSVDKGANQPAHVVLFKRDDSEQVADGNWPQANPDQKQDDLPTVLKSEDNEMNLEEQVQALEAKNTELADKLAKSEFMASLTDAHKAYYADLSDADKIAFSKKTTVERDQIIKVAKAADETIEIDGATVRKSEMGEAAFCLLKSQIQKNVELQKKVEAEEAEKLQKQAEAEAEKEFGHLAGTPAGKAKVLKAAREDAEMMRVLKSADEFARSLMEDKGSADRSTGSADNPAAKLDKIAKSWANERKITENEAYLQVMDTPEGRELYAQMVRDKQ